MYNPVLYGSLGYDLPKQLLFTGIWANITIVGNTICAFTVDKVGRVRNLKFGWIGDLIAMIGIIVSIARYEATGSSGAARAGVFFLYLHIACYALFVDATT